MKINSLLGLAILALLPVAAKAECVTGPEVVVNVGQGASIVFEQPVYQAKIFDPSQVVLNQIPESGTDILMLTQINPLTFPGLPSGNEQTTLLAQTENTCYTFQISFGQGNQHVSVNATDNEALAASLGSTESNLPPLDLELLRAALDDAIAKVGADNAFVQKTEQFLILVDEGVAQRVAAQRLQIEWDHLIHLANNARFGSTEDTVSL